MVIITNMDMPEKCEACRWFSFRGAFSHWEGEGQPSSFWLLDSRCQLLPPEEDWYARDNPDRRSGWVGEDLARKGWLKGYYSYRHCVEGGTRARQCPLREV